jgi:enoyl-CoA hydratase/carnithine racemase
VIVVPLDALGELLHPNAREEWSPLAGNSLLAVDLDRGRVDEAQMAELRELPCVKLGVAGDPDLPEHVLDAFDVLVTTAEPLAGWVQVDDLAGEVVRLRERADAQPLAACAFVALVRLTERLPVWEAVAAESATYSMLLGSDAFLGWRAETARKEQPEMDPDQAVLIARDGPVLYVELNRPAVRNAVDISLRDGLVAALQLPLNDPTIDRVVLTGRGPSFSAGGDLNEFGTVRDPALANAVRLTRHPGIAVHRLRSRIEARLHGASMGSGVEIPAFAGKVVADPSARFGLPELGMGLVPGAGGTVSVTHRVGRHRSAWFVLSGDRIGADTALAWGLVDEIDDVHPSA